MNKKLMEKINALTGNAFISTADTRVASAKRLERLETDLVENKKALEEAIEEKEKLKAQIETLNKTKAEMDGKYKDMFENSERLRIRLEERERTTQRVEEQMKCLRDSLPPDERAQVEKSSDIM